MGYFTIYKSEKELEVLHRNWTTESINIKDKNLILDFVPNDIISVLDYGCGSGRYSENFDNYIGFDRNKFSVAFARKMYPNKEFTIELPDKKFDLVLAVSVIQYQPDDELGGVIDEVCSHSKRYVLIQTWDKNQGETKAIGSYNGGVAYMRAKSKYYNVLQKYGNVKRIILNKEPNSASCIEDSFKVIYLLEKTDLGN